MYDSNSSTYKILDSLHDTYYLMNVVDNDFIESDLEAVFWEFITSNWALIH